jgi:hypothetical protein
MQVSRVEICIVRSISYKLRWRLKKTVSIKINVDVSSEESFLNLQVSVRQETKQCAVK